MKNSPLDHLGLTVPHERLEALASLPIDPGSGCCEEAVNYPSTFPNPEKLHTELERKRTQYSSGRNIEQEMVARKRIEQISKKQEATKREEMQPQATAVPGRGVNWPKADTMRPGTKRNENSNSKVPVNLHQINWPKANCKVVPATEDHFAEIAEIIHLESGARDRVPQVLDGGKITVKDIVHIGDMCRLHYRPFVVAINESAELMTDRARWPEQAHDEFAEYMAWKRDQPKEKAAVVGFAYVTEAKVGFLDKPDPGARNVGAIRLVVHPGHRGKKYGSALLDRICQSTAPYHRSLVDHEWRGLDEGNLVYERNVAYNQRQYSHVFIEVHTADGDREMKWKRKMLEKFDFVKIARFDKMLRTDRGEDSQDLSLEVWRMETSQAMVNMEPGRYLEKRTRF